MKYSFKNEIIKPMIFLILIKGILILSGCFMFLTSIFMFIGGPDGRFLEKQPVIYGLVCLGISFLLFYLIFKIENMIEEYKSKNLSPVLGLQERQHDNKVNNTKKFLPYWFSAIWFFGIFTASVMGMPHFKNIQWSVGHSITLMVIFFGGAIVFFLWLIAVPIFLLTKKYKISEFQSIQILLSIVVLVVLLILRE